MEIVLAVLAGFLSVWYIVQKFARDTKEELSVRLDKLEASDKAEHAEPKTQVGAQGKDLAELRVEVDKLSGFNG